jgi:acyl-coenzyme A synthetase/AMP-(fatty) acid ligase
MLSYISSAEFMVSLNLFIYRYPHEEAGQIPVALVVRQPGSKVTEAQVMDHVAKRVAPYKKIRKVLFVESIPKSPAGKILRRQLTNHVQAGAVSRM